MNFTVVDIPTAPSTPSSPIVEALLKNVGKAISIPCDKRDPNTVRKTLRASLANRGILKTNLYRTRVDTKNAALIAWLEPIAKSVEGDGVTQDGSQPERMR